MRDLVGDLGFPQEAYARGFVTVMRLQDLHRGGVAGAQIACTIHGGDAAHADQALELPPVFQGAADPFERQLFARHGAEHTENAKTPPPENRERRFS